MENKENTTKKTLKQFLEILLKVTEENLIFLQKGEANQVIDSMKYLNELAKIQEVINSFDFIR